ncbi:MAG TPA: thioesterase family protein [Candidatus Krumholzibacteria bacterium]|nr:thioesterase family protein [Candidatus Krumholzibacteria bacterium]
MTFSAEFDVRFGDIDHARVVYYPRFFHYFHQAFEEWFGRALGVSYPDLVLKENVGYPSVRVESEFLRPLRYGDRIRVDLELLDVGRTSITVRYTLVRLTDGEVSARATIKNVAIDNDTFEPVVISEAWRGRFERFRTGAEKRP